MSTVIFTTLGFSDVTPATQVGKLLIAAEVIIGYVMLGALLAILANRGSQVFQTPRPSRIAPCNECDSTVLSVSYFGITASWDETVDGRTLLEELS